jgi:hypothetical protein
MKTRVLAIALMTASVLLTEGVAIAQAPPRPGPPSGMPGLQPAQGAKPQAATNLFLVSPPANAIIQPGSGVMIAWTGGVPSWKVNVSLIDYTAWVAVAGVASNIPNSTGSQTWQFPTTLDCSHKYQFYIAEANNATWTYGPVFTIKCDIELVKTHSSALGYTLTILNKGSKFTGPGTISIADNLPTGMKAVSGLGTPNPLAWAMVPPNTVGPAPVNITYAIPAGTTIASNSTIGSYTFQTMIDQKNCATAKLSLTNGPASETNTANNTACAQ